MDVFTFVIIVVIVGCGTGVLMEYMKNKRDAKGAAVQPELESELVELRQRVEVLERIVTDEKYHLEKEIDRLERSA
jgi:hypothetical protein